MTIIRLSLSCQYSDVAMNSIGKLVCISLLWLLFIIIDCNCEDNGANDRNRKRQEEFGELTKLITNVADKSGKINELLIPEKELGRGYTGCVWKGIN